MDTIEFTRWFLAFFFAGVAIFYWFRIAILTRSLHKSPVFKGAPGTLHYASHIAFRVFRALILGVCVGRLIWPPFDQFIVPFDILWHPAVLMVGNTFLLAAFFAILFLNLTMGRNWRSGTRDWDETELLTKGAFAFSRHPMMLCVLLGQLGFFLALPSLFSLICLIVGMWAVLAQVSVEERILENRHGASFGDYARHTSKWLPFGHPFVKGRGTDGQPRGSGSSPHQA